MEFFGMVGLDGCADGDTVRLVLPFNPPTLWTRLH